METEPQFEPGDRCFSHYVMQWGTIKSLNHTRRNERHGVTGSKLPDTTWYNVDLDNGEVVMLDDAHGDWDMARIVPPHIASKYGYGDDPRPYTVRSHTAPMTGAFWFVVTDNRGWLHGSQVGPYYDDHEDAQAAADELNEGVTNDV